MLRNMKTKCVFNIPSQTQTITEGDLLIADPSLRESIFHRSVVLLAQHSNEGAFGLILNQRSDSVVGDYLKDETFTSLSRIPVFLGGPVAKSHLTFAAFWMSPNNELRFAVRISAEEAIARSKQPGTLVKAFAGYSGWSSGQLEEEINHNTWVPSPAPDNFLGLNHDKSLWGRALNELSPFHRLLALCPEAPSLN